LQLPGVLLPSLLLLAAWKWFDFSVWFVFIGIFIFIAKDVVLFPFVWKAYDTRSPDGLETMIGDPGVAEERLDPEGYVRVRGELWLARTEVSHNVIEKGMRIRVVGGSGLTLLVVADPLKNKE
jgi:membrane-bound serine protease (ClpP class)